MDTFHATTDDHGLRLDLFLHRERPALSRSRIQTLIRSSHILVNGESSKPGLALRRGMRIDLTEPEPLPSAAQAEDLPLQILFEDEFLAVINKPAGLVVHPAAGNWSGTLVNALLHHCKDLSGIGGELRPGIVHRLDKETSGCIVVAKTDVAHRALAEQFSGREILKLYLAYVRGIPRHPSGTIAVPIDRHPVQRKRMAVARQGTGRAARTDYEVLLRGENSSLLLCRLYTGRTHQIRVHLHHLGHPLLGDPSYGGPKIPDGRVMLHAWRLGFCHPIHQTPIQFDAPVPEDFLALGAPPNPHGKLT